MKSVTLHNIPEGLSLGVAFGVVAANLSSATIEGAVALAIGIGLHMVTLAIMASFFVMMLLNVALG